jgi:plasmid stabilization system protein ParE
MKRFFIRISTEAETDIDDVFRYITSRLMAPETAIRYKDGIIHEIYKLTFTGDIYPASQYESIQRRYGPVARTDTYRTMTVVFKVMDVIILVRRVMAGSLIM